MNVLILLLLAVSKIDGFLIDTKNSKTEDSVLLRKLHHLQKRSEPEIVQIPTWSEMLADVMVNRIKIFSFHKHDEHAASTEYVAADTTEPGIVIRAVSTVLNIFKTYIYDPWYHVYGSKANEVENLRTDEAESSDPKDDVEIIQPNPSKDVEIIEPKYHGKLCDNCTENPQEKCPDGLEMDVKGDCVDPKASQYIFKLPYHCPIGYRLDWFGICRLTL